MDPLVIINQVETFLSGQSDEGWIRHDGKKPPVAPFLTVEVVTLGNLHRSGNAGEFYWQAEYGGIETVKKYRLIQMRPIEKEEYCD